VYYIPYMLLKHQLIDQCKAKLIIEGVEVYFEAHPTKGTWLIKANIDYPLEELTPTLQDNLQSLNYVKIQSHGGFLKAYPKEGFVVVFQEIKIASDFILFKAAMKEFMSIYDLWKSVVDDIVRSDGLLLI